MLFDYLRRHHVALLALVIALGGTSYAAVQLPKNSVGTTQIKPKAVTPAKLSKKVQTQLAAAGTAGPPGAAGPKGDPGDKGDLGPTSAGVGGTNTSVTPTAGSPILGTTTVTLSEPGKVLVLMMGTFSVRCTAAGACTRQISVQVGGTTVPGAFGSIDSTANVEASQTVDAAGILANVPAGTHTVTIASRVATGAATTANNGGDVRLVAVALG
jgi:hypothetical protein